MTLEQIVCTKGQSERLRKAGWTKETVFKWVYSESSCRWLVLGHMEG
jgi:hypothetical protein